jgi:hypothetical protein
MFLEEKGLIRNRKLAGGYGYSIETKADPETYLAKFQKRWGYTASTYQFLEGKILILGPIAQ